MARKTAPGTQNLWTQSVALSNAAWTAGNVTVAENVTAPLGGVGSTITENANGVNSYSLQRNTPSLRSPRFTCSAYMKMGTRRYALFGCSSVAFQWFDLQSGAVGLTSAAAGAGLVSAIEDAGDGWYRCRASMNALFGVAVYIYQWFLAAADGAASYNGSVGTIGGYWFGPQLVEASEVFHPYRETSGSVYDDGAPRIPSTR